MEDIIALTANNKITKIALTLTSLASGGAEKQCLLLASMLGKFYEVLVIVVDETPKHQTHLLFISGHNLRVIFLRGSMLKKTIQLRQIFHKEKIDLIFSYLPKDIILTSLALGSRPTNHIGGIRNAQMSTLKRNLLRYVHNKRLTASISNCYSGKDFFTKKGFIANKIRVIPNGIEIDRAPSQRLERNKINISSLGRLVDQKDYLTALKSFKHLLHKTSGERDLDLQYGIYGQGPEQAKIQEHIKALELSKHVTIHTDALDISSILQETDIYLCTSLYEGVSNAIMEAMVYSLPIVATDAGDNSLLVEDQINGYILPKKDEVGIGNALVQLIGSSTLRKKMGAASFKHIQANFNLDLFLKRYLSYIEGL